MSYAWASTDGGDIGVRNSEEALGSAFSGGRLEAAKRWACPKTGR